jgi:hypothetical protein
MDFKLLLLTMVSIFSLLWPFSSKSFGQTDSSGHGVYVLNSMEEAFKSGFLSSSTIRGISPRIKWSTVEPSEGRYNWSYLDSVFQDATRSNKTVILRVHPGTSSPEWVYQAGAKRLKRPGFPGSMPAPWDPIYLTKWTNFVKVLGQRYGGNSSLYIVGIAGPTMGSIEFHLLGPKAEWERAGYTPAKVLDAWKTCIDAFAQAFPNKAIALNITFQILGDRQLPEQIVEYGLNTYKNRVFIQGNWLSVDTPPGRLNVMRQFSARTTVGFQMLGTSERMKGLRKAIDNGLAGGASYLEIYASDFAKSQFREDIQYAATQLQTPLNQRKLDLSPRRPGSNRSRLQKSDLGDDSEMNRKASSSSPSSGSQLAQQLRQAKRLFLNNNFQGASEELRNARNSLTHLQEEYPQIKDLLIKAQATLDQTIDHLNRKDFRETQRLYRETLDILKMAKQEILEP